MRARLAGNDVIEPGRIGFCMGCSHDFHPVAAPENGAQRRILAIYFCRHAAVADIGMHCVGEIHRGGVLRQRQYLALGRKYVDLAGKQINLEMFQEFQGIGGIAKRLQQALQPLMGFHMQIVEICIGTLIEPVRSNACLGDSVHFGRANLHFDGGAVRPHRVLCNDW